MKSKFRLKNLDTKTQHFVFQKKKKMMIDVYRGDHQLTLFFSYFLRPTDAIILHSKIYLVYKPDTRCLPYTLIWLSHHAFKTSWIRLTISSLLNFIYLIYWLLPPREQITLMSQNLFWKWFGEYFSLQLTKFEQPPSNKT